MEASADVRPDGSSQQPAPPQQSTASCDRCDERITGLRHKCQACPDFDYCSNCFAHAALVHPGHSFETIGDRAEAEAESDQAGGDGQGHPNASVDGPVPASGGPGKEYQCISCAAVTDPLSALSLFIQGQGGSPPAEIDLRWKLRLSHLVEATQRGCAFCAFVLTKFFGPSNGVSFVYHPERGPWYAAPSKHDSERKGVVDHCMATLTRLKHDRFGFTVTASCSRKGGVLPDFDTLVVAVSSLFGREKSEVQGVFNSAGILQVTAPVYAAKGDIAAEHLSSRPPNASPGSDAGMQQAQLWLKRCEESHGQSCGTVAGAVLPACVIDVSESRLRLFQPSPAETGRYAAVSYHRGGDAGEFQTTSKNFEERIAGFPLESLPSAFQDAVVVTRNLGIRYLWIDSICLLQESEENSATKASQMAYIYQNAHLTISAAASESASAGFLKSSGDPETGLWRNLVPVKYPIVHPDAKTMEEALRMPRTAVGTIWLLDEDPALAKTWSDPIASEAWSFQEQIISRRLLSYGRWPQWRCSKSTNSDGGFYLDRSSGPEERQLLGAVTRAPRGSADLFTTSQVHRSWCKILNAYTKSEPSLESERLPAIGGLAAEISRITGVGYHAGLWGNNLVYDLMWYAETREWLNRPQEWRAPTWSWASVQAPVTYADISDDATPLAVAHGCDVSPAAGHTAFGEVISGKLEISGPMAELRREDVIQLFAEQDLAPPPPKSNRVSDWYAQMLEHIANQPKHKVSAEEAEAALPERVFGLLTFSAEWRIKYETRLEERCYSGLLLREVEGGNFERIGAFTNEVFGWLDQDKQAWDTRRVVLV